MIPSGCNRPSDRQKSLFDVENLVAWCIVPFDAEDRTPEERAEMLDNLGIRKMAYDYRDRNLPQFENEIGVLREHGIELTAVWLWVDPDGEGVYSNANREVFRVLEKTGTRTRIWLGVPENAFGSADPDTAFKQCTELVRAVLAESGKIGCPVSLYNHGGWFGEPENQIRIIEAIGSDSLGIVYNFHHGHGQIGRFSELLEKMLPYLTTVNINGMKEEGPMILPVGEGDSEEEMLRLLLDSGFNGPIGILGHTENEDIRPVLERNLEGLDRLKKRL
jgi:sugar phosphate isomerase/epimerase